MAIEQGVVIKMGLHGPATAWVRTVRSSACESCSSKSSCHTGGGTSQEVEAINDAGARIGDRIQLSISSGALLKATFLLYLFPVLCMLAGGLLGNWIAPSFRANPSGVAAISALLFLGISLLIVRAGGQHLGGKESYRPRIIRVIGREPHDPWRTDPVTTCGHEAAPKGH
jgi:sigma-E factor negative regulatory protein RseC